MNEERPTFEKKLESFEQHATSVILELADGSQYVGTVSRNFATGEWQISTRRPPFPETVREEITFEIGEIARLSADGALFESEWV